MSRPQSNDAHFTRAQIENTLANLEEDLKRWDHEHDLRWRCAEAEAQSELSWSKCSEATRRWSAAFLDFLDAPSSQIDALDLRETTKDCEETRAAYLLATNACRALRQEWTTHMDESAANHKADLLARLEYVRSLTTAEENPFARALFEKEYENVEGEDWDRAAAAVHEFWIGEARAQIESEKANN
jgi:hypothetical protein